MEKSNFRVRVMKYAHQLAKTTEYTWKICLIKAWELYRLAKNMKLQLDDSVIYSMGNLTINSKHKYMTLTDNILNVEYLTESIFNMCLKFEKVTLKE